MAALGAIGFTRGKLDIKRVLDVWAATHAAHGSTLVDCQRVIRPLPWWAEYGSMLSHNMTGYLSGTVMEEGYPVANSMVQLFHKGTGLCLAKTRSASDGTFRFDNLSADESAAYFVVAHDVPGGTNYKAVIMDQLTAAT